VQHVSCSKSQSVLKGQKNSEFTEFLKRLFDSIERCI